MNINSAFENMFRARNIQVRLALISQSHLLLISYEYKPLILSSL